MFWIKFNNLQGADSALQIWDMTEDILILKKILKINK